MSIRKVWSGLVGLGLIWVTGCGDNIVPPGSQAVRRYIDETPPADLSRRDAVAATMAFSDPALVLFIGTFMPLFLDTDARSIDPNCPRFVDRSDTAAEIVDWRIQGSCTATDEFGVMTYYEGQIVARGDADGTVIRYENFGSTEIGDCGGATVEVTFRWKGEVHLPFALLLEGAGDQPEEPPDPGEPLGEEGYPPGAYVVSLLLDIEDVDEACQPATSGIAYDVRLDIRTEDDGSATRDVVQMDGRAARRDSGGLLMTPDPAGSWSLSADGYVLAPDTCSSEPLAGALTVKAGDEEATVHPDGSTRCAQFDEPPCAPWSQNGEDQSGEICNYTGCSAGPDASPPWIALAILLAGLLWQRRHAHGRAPDAR
jgi:MYXO-CTERM domain-containing protein